MNRISSAIGHRLALFLTQPLPGPPAGRPTPPALLRASLQPADVLLVEGHSRIASGIKYLTQSTWSHAALYVGFASGLADPAHCLVEADLTAGVRSIDLSVTDGFHTRICRPVGLSAAERKAVCDAAIGRIGHRYDLRNVFDLARFLLPHPPVPARFRRRLIALGSGDPTRAICSTLIAQAFESIGYPVLPDVAYHLASSPTAADGMAEVLHLRHHSLYAPRDFDVSPYFEVVKPTIAMGFDFHALTWDTVSQS